MVVVDGKKYESEMLSKIKEEALFYITWKPWDSIKNTWDLKRRENPGSYSIIENQSKFYGFKLNERVKLLILLLSEYPRDIAIFLHDLRFMQGDNNDVTQIMTELYPMGFYSSYGSLRRWRDIIVMEDSQDAS